MVTHHTLLLLQKTPSPQSRTFFDYNSISKAVEGFIEMFETELKLKFKSIKLTYTEDDVYQFMDSFKEIVVLVNEQIHGSKMGYLPKDTSWFKTKIHDLLLMRAKPSSLSTSSSSTSLSSNSLAKKMQRLTMSSSSSSSSNSTLSTSTRRSTLPQQQPPPPPPTEFMTKSFAERYNVPTSDPTSNISVLFKKKNHKHGHLSSSTVDTKSSSTRTSVLGRLGKKSLAKKKTAPPKKTVSRRLI